MSQERTDSTHARRRRREARHWYSVHRSGRALSGRRLKRWRQWSADPANGVQYDQLVFLYDVLLSLEPPRPTDDGLRTALGDQVGLRRYLPRMELRNWLRESFQLARELWIQSPRPVVFAVTAILAAYGIASLTSRTPLSLGILTASAHVYETRSGELRRFTLPDGSVATLKGVTTVKFDISARERAAVLAHGGAVFQVSHNPTLPFRVYAGTGTTTAVGTAFYVEDSSDRVIVQVIEGTVVIDPRGQMSTQSWNSLFRPADFQRPAPVEVTNGNELTYNVRGAAGAVHATNSKAVVALLNAPLVYRHRPLQEVVDDVQHYSSRRIDVDPAAGDLPFTGKIGRESIDRWVRGLPKVLPVNVVDSDHGHLRIRVVPPPPQAEP